VSSGDVGGLEERRILLRRWTLRRLVLPGYCRRSLETSLRSD